MLHANVDGDIIKYSCGFACQKAVFLSEDGHSFLFERQANGMKVTCIETGDVTKHEGLFTKNDIMKLYGGDWSEEVRPEPVHHVLHTVKRLLNSILSSVGADSYTVYLSKGDCYRVGVYPDYKANRLSMPKPHHIKTIEDYLVQQQGAIVCTEIEADDAMGIHQYQSLKRGENTVICSLDKDLDMIPGLHYNWTKKQIYFVTEEQGIHNFWRQMLTGDAVDNIPGIAGIGPKTALKIIDGCDDYQATVMEQYTEHGFSREEFERNAQLLWILRKSLEETYGKSYQDFFTR